MAVERNFDKIMRTALNSLLVSITQFVHIQILNIKIVSGSFTRNVATNSSTFTRAKTDQFARSSPLKWLKMNPGAKPGTESGRKRTPEQIEEFKNRMAEYRTKNNKHQKDYKPQLIEKL